MLRLIREEQARRAEVAERIRISERAEQIRANCATLMGFIREAWHILEPSTKLAEGWALDAVCEHFEAITTKFKDDGSLLLSYDGRDMFGGHVIDGLFKPYRSFRSAALVG